MPRPVGASRDYLPGLDGLRAVAVVAVLAYHLGAPWLPGGLLGVGVFFTLSGFLITSLLLTAVERHGRIDLKDFWLRRARRLLPALAAMLAAVLVATALVYPDDLPRELRESLAAVLYVNNWTDIVQGDSYFDRFSPPAPLDHLWSLAVEEQFYLLWPPLLIGILALVRGHRKAAAAITALLAAGSFWLMATLATPGFDNTRAYEGTDTRAGGLLVGAVLALAWTRRRVDPGGPAPRLLTPLGIVGLAAMVTLMATMDDYAIALYRWGFVALSLATLAVVASVAHPATAMSRILGAAPLRWIGERSYGIYLWHLPVIALLPSGFLAEHPLHRSLVALAMTVAIAALSWAMVEDPIRRHGLRRALLPRRSRRSASPARRHAPVLLGVAVVIAVGAGSIAGAATVHDRRAEAATLPSATPSTVAASPTPTAASTPTPTPASSPSATPAPSPTATLVAGMTSCASVVHVGDSTSVGLTSDQVLPVEEQIVAQYERVGIEDVRTDISGARSIVERVNGQPNAREAVAAQIDAGYEGCWVIAQGTNEVANQYVGGVHPLDERIDTIMSTIGTEEPVLWLTVTTLRTQGPYRDAEMKKWNAAVADACDRWPNIRVYDWRSEVKDAWFLSDGIHFTTAGYRERGARIADALAVAFPRGGQPSTGCVVGSAAG
ncbi:acyltransferase family protein [Demequina sp. SYSU T00039]|uniref:Acyltransferase family protein n=1 Tax=Demequina lignilytica TaxID=3051663 RepID=A0AAW7M220_9MICO|nr:MULTISPECIES: acyltransferase family protein [unclassified Demequina]MDN4479284.1 acyltransferase family protein [Demequina sp. SYSU T00039-1]MDN4488743.1 acyltransferase family protein [Demequina sp. SYSU T00039]